jgi:enoyl-[acyl-carrier protein] reductase I
MRRWEQVRKMARSGGLLEGKRGLVMGVANTRSIAWGSGKACRGGGAELALT